MNRASQVKSRTVWVFLMISVGSLVAQPFWQLPDDSASIGIFKYDFLTRAFEGGQLQHFGPCETLDSTGFPWIFTTQPPGDFGWDMFRNACSGDTVFYGTIVWAGLGSIAVPRSFLAPDSFPVSTQQPSIPHSYHIIDHAGLEQYFPDIILRADTIWNDLADRSIIDAFGENIFHVNMYFYPPSLGATDYTVAKWIVFVYRNPYATSVKDRVQLVPEKYDLQLTVYPNPFNGEAKIQYRLSEAGHVRLVFFDILGHAVYKIEAGYQTEGEQQVTYQAETRESGLLICRVMVDDKPRAIQKIVILK